MLIPTESYNNIQISATRPIYRFSCSWRDKPLFLINLSDRHTKSTKYNKMYNIIISNVICVSINCYLIVSSINKNINL